MSIQPLSSDVIAQIKSSTTIINLNTVILELVKNSLDAKATKIDVTVDYGRGGCVVEDDGEGILPSEFEEAGGLGKLYHSSKINPKTSVHGGRGTFLASLSAMSLLTITSHHHLYRSHNTMSMHRSLVVSRQVPASSQHHLPYFAHGTRVSVRDLFGNMPVRVKQRAALADKAGGNTKDWDDLKRDLVLLLLAWSLSISLTVREVGTNMKLTLKSPTPGPESNLNREVSKVSSLLLQANFIASRERSLWVPVNASSSKLKLYGAICLEPCAIKQYQFLAFGVQPLISLDGQSILHEEVNRLFQNSAFGNVEEVEELGEAEKIRRSNNPRRNGNAFTNKELKGRKGVDRWPIYYINIQQKASGTRHAALDPNDILDDKDNSFNNVTQLLQAVIVGFLTKNHFRPRHVRENIEPSTGGGKVAEASSQTHSRKRSPAKVLKTSRNDTPSSKQATQRQSFSNSDLLGSDMKIPSFRASSISTSPFDAWSRVKSGSPHPKLNTSNESVPSSISDIPRPVTAPLPERQSSPSIARSQTPAAKSTKSNSSFVTSKGNITRLPFDEVEISGPKTCPSTPQEFPLDNPSTRDPNDEVIAWINPITKITSMVNQRTGHTLPTIGSTLGGRSSATGLTALSLRKKLKSTIPDIGQAPSPWIGSVLRDWDNPIFQATELAIPQISIYGLVSESQKLLHGHSHNCSQVDIDKAFKATSAGVQGRISKEALKRAEVISQVDRKFILVKLHCSDGANKPTQDTLVIIDQHAADERIRIEALLTELCTAPNLPSESRILTILLDKPLTYEISTKELELLRTHQRHFNNWGILYNLPQTPITENTKYSQRLLVYSLPPCISERCKLNPRLLIDLIRTEAWRVHSLPSPISTADITSPTPSQHTWIPYLHTLPPGLMDMLNSRACRSAIMFNDDLTTPQCEALVRRLAGCAFPFQCAHGRPSLVPLVELGRIWGDRGGEDGEWEGGVGDAMKKWRDGPD